MVLRPADASNPKISTFVSMFPSENRWKRRFVVSYPTHPAGPNILNIVIYLQELDDPTQINLHKESGLLCSFFELP